MKTLSPRRSKRPPKTPAWVWAPPDVSTQAFSNGPKEGRPVIHEISVSHEDQRNGWYLVPRDYTLSVTTENADTVTFFGFYSGNPDPQKDGLMPVVSKKTTQDGTTQWIAKTFHQLAGQTVGVYAVAKNDEGQTASEVLWIAWLD